MYKRQERTLTTPQHYAYLKISEGCDRKCSYCAIPITVSYTHLDVYKRQEVQGVRAEMVDSGTEVECGCFAVSIDSCLLYTSRCV